MAKDVLFLDGCWGGLVYPCSAGLLESGTVPVQTKKGNVQQYHLHTISMDCKVYNVATIHDELDSRHARFALRQAISSGRI